MPIVGENFSIFEHEQILLRALSFAESLGSFAAVKGLATVLSPSEAVAARDNSGGLAALRRA